LSSTNPRRSILSFEFPPTEGVRPDLPTPKFASIFRRTLRLEIQIQFDYRASLAGLDLSTSIIASFLKGFATFFVKTFEELQVFVVCA
jgi:hypothetical protein